MDAITICAANYLPFVSVLGNSFLDNHPDSKFYVLVIDSKKVEFQKNKNFIYLTPDDLDIPTAVFENMAFYYNVTELATALKPSALKTLFRLGSNKVIYLDPDIQVFSEFTELDSALENNPIVLTPHTLKPIPRDDLRPTEADIMGSGTFNLGFLGLSKSIVANEMLDWWEERLRFDSISDPLEMLFTDQRWIDLVPSYFPICVLRTSSYNVAYWNLHERELAENKGKITVDGQELRFFHFSGYRPDIPWLLSKYVADNPRIVISKNSILANLCEQYSKKATSAGWKSEYSVKYGYENFENGKFIPSSLRRLYREDCIAAHKEGNVLEPPVNWQEWATNRSIQSGNLSRILFSIWKSRPDLKRRYPDATGTEAADLQNWAKTHGVEEKVIDESLLEIGLLKNDVFPSMITKKYGLNIAGYLNGELGLGQSARLIYEAAKNTGIPITTINSNRVHSRQEEKFEVQNSDIFYPITIAVVNADHFHLWAADVGVKKLMKSTVIGVWAWEIEDFPSYMHKSFDYVDEIWAVSNFVKDAISKHTKKPIFVLPTPILPPNNIEVLERSQLQLPENSKYNLFIFDYMSVFNRKNPLGLVEAHKVAFPDQDGPLLVIKSANGDKDAINREKLRFAVKDREDILLIEDFMSRSQLTALINECQLYISLHRSEGYGLTMAEAMALGKTVIATKYSGNLDFMNSENSYLVSCSKVKVGPGSYPYNAESYWAEPYISEAANMIRNFWLDENKSRDFLTKSKLSVMDEFTLSKTSEFIKLRIDYHNSFIAKSNRKLSRKVSQVKKWRKFLKKLIST